jgi:hypothetical protein
VDNAIHAILSFITAQLVFFCLGIFAITFVVKQIIEYIITNWTPMNKESKIWTNLFLPILPVILGVLVVICVGGNYQYPPGFDSYTGKLNFGLVGGLLSGLVYRVLKSFLVSKISGDPSNPEIEQLAAQVRDTIQK